MVLNCFDANAFVVGAQGSQSEGQIVKKLAISPATNGALRLEL